MLDNIVHKTFEVYSISSIQFGTTLEFVTDLFLAPPQFTRTPVDQIGVQGGVASFVCQATGDPQPRITWSRKGKKVTNQRFEVIEFEDGSGSVLRVQPLRTPRDEAVYECVASNEAGEISSSTRLSVLREDQLPAGFPSIDMGPQLKVVERSRTATMLCAASGTPDPEITWFKDFLPIDTYTHGRIKQLRSGALQIDQSEETDQGKYECVATNSEGTRYSAPANLYVRDHLFLAYSFVYFSLLAHFSLPDSSVELRDVRRIPPRFSVPPMDYEIMPGGSVNISCQAVGVPMPYVKWMLGSEDLTPEDDMPIGRNVLELTDVSQSVNYTCVAMSTLGVIETIAQITVKALPNPPGAPVVMERSATSITLMWDSGNPLPVSYYIIQYRPASSTDPFKEIDAIATTRYSVGGLSPYSHYHFRVMAVNSIGRGPPSQTVEARTAEQAPSSPPRRVRGRMLSGSTAMVQWEEPEEANGQVVGYRVYYTSDSSLLVNQWEKEMVRGANFLNIRDLTPNKTYYIRVLAFTAVGDGPLSSDLHIIAKTGVPSQPTELKAEVKSETSILLSWIPPAHSGTDAITSYELIYRLGDQPEQKISFDPSSSYLLKNLKPFSTYIFQLAARSKHGLGAFTSEITVQTPQTLEKDLVQRISDIPSNCFRYRIEGLKKGTLYSVTVAAYTDTGQGPESLPILIRTEEDVPSAPPRGVDVVVLNTTSARVSWKPPVAERQHGRIRGYQVTYARRTAGERTVSPRLRELLLRDPQDLILTDLWPNTEYSVTVAAFTSKGDGARSKPTVIRTKPSLPGMPLLTVTPSEDGSALLKWQPPPAGVSPVLGYRLSYGQADPTSDSFMVQELDSEKRSYTVSSLSAGVLYVFQLAARTIWGYGSSAQITLLTPNIVQTTTDDMVTAPGTTDAQNVSVQEAIPLLANLTAESINSSSVILRWEPPKSSDRIQGYRVWFAVTYSNGTDIAMESDVLEATVILNGLRPNTEYVARVCMLSKHGPGPYSVPISIKTQPAQEVFAVNFRVKAAMKSSVLLSWESRTSSNKAQSLVLLREINGTGHSVRLRRQAEAKPYISAHFQNLPAEFKLGDGRVYGAFMNRPLVNGQECVCFVLAILELGQNTLYSTSPFSDVVLFSDVEPQPIVDEEEGLLWVVGPVLAVIFIISIVILILLFKRKRAELEGRKCSFPSSSKAMSSQHPSDPVELRRINFPTAGMTSHPPVSISELPAHVERMKANDSLRFSQEYESIDPGQQFSWEHSNLEINKPKNRYANVIAYDHTRVALSNNDGVPGGDYINANFIDGYRRQGAYIATQGPMPDTFSDFWRLVWEQHTANIIMITKLEEKSRNKCDQYWPSRGTETYGLMQVTLLDTVELATYCVRTFALIKSGSGEKRELRQFQFTAWPDQGVPEHPTLFLAFLRRVKACNPPDAGPIVVHCSAGVGRTGCFIVIDAMLERVKQEKTIDVYGHVTLMRSQRNYMVQTEEQYVFIYEALLEAVSCGNTEVPARNLYAYIQRLSQTEPPEHISGMEQEFKEKCHQYWPSDRSARYQYFVVDPMAEYNMPQYILREFKVTDARDGQSRTVRQFQFTDWPEQGVPKSGEGFIDFIGQVHKTKEQFGQDGPITVHCSAGVGRTGVFITLSIVLERMRYEGVVDIFQTVKMLRTQRPAMVQTEEQYQFCYRAALEYLGSFDHYAT
ncbi:hypothetical protein cypCar_00029108 [Cyprinus carpio]|nr:hypothetical protein cypCar_00029108 [Cyprinus carpio]